jgi:hypothetical protein
MSNPEQQHRTKEIKDLPRVQEELTAEQAEQAEGGYIIDWRTSEPAPVTREDVIQGDNAIIQRQ